MSDLSQFLDRIADDIKREFAALIKECKPLAGLLETTDLAALHANTPAIYIATVGTGELTPVASGERDIKVFIIAYVLVVNADSIERERITQEIVNGLLIYVPLRRWGVKRAFPALAVESSDLHGLSKGFKPDVTTWRTSVSALSRASDLYGGTDPVSNLALWGVSWEQVLRLPAAQDTDDFKPPREVLSRNKGQTGQVYPENQDTGAR